MSLVSRLDETLGREVQARAAPGAAAALFLDGAPRWSGAAGVRQAGRPDGLEPEARFPIYSITKTFTAVAALRLCEQGRLSLEATADRWFPDLPWASRVRVSQLLDHTAGVFDYSALARYHQDVAAHPETPWSFQEFVERAARQPLSFDPGEGWSYSNTGYTLAKRILEEVSGEGFGALIEEQIASPLGLARTGALETLAQMQDLTPGHTEQLPSPTAPGLRDPRGCYHPGWCGTGLLASTADEICRFFEAVFEGSLLRPASRERMLRLRRVPGHHPPATEPSYGLGIMADPKGSRGPDYGHGGGGPGWNLRAAYAPGVGERRVGVAVLCNHDAEDAWPIATALVDAAARELEDAGVC